MGFADTWYPSTLTVMRAFRGEGANGSDGVVMPRLSGSDGIAMLGMVSPQLVRAVRTFQQRSAPTFGGKVGGSDLVDDGIFDANPTSIAKMGSALLDAASYVAGYGNALARPYQRLAPFGATYLYEPFITHSVLGADQDGILAFLRQTMGDWQRAVDAAAVMISNVPSVTSEADAEDVAPFLYHLRALCRDLDVLQENPPASDASRIKAAALGAVRDTEQFAGEAAAKIAGSVGEGAGLVAKGFFSEAGVTSLIVAGIAVWLFVK